jgi:hypothetical protein
VAVAPAAATKDDVGCACVWLARDESNYLVDGMALYLVLETGG